MVTTVNHHVLILKSSETSHGPLYGWSMGLFIVGFTRLEPIV
jgi:hypothetical protein